ncbi:MAG: hypothetical protein O7A09_11040 [Proteobacteria bacterium]|nr:hypothetical protein [Pseudomonadota bacterium]
MSASANGEQADAGPGEVSLAPRGGYRSEVERAWFRGGADLGTRATRTRIRALELGMDNVEAAARALIAPGARGDSLGRAMLAVRLAPDLPMAHIALAGAHWEHGERRPALEAVVDGLLAIPRHLEATVWLASSLLVMFAVALVAGSLYFGASVGVAAFSHAAHDLGDLLSRSMPAFARTALLGSLLLLPLLAGEGVLGLVVALFALGFTYGSPRHRVVLALSAVLVVIGMYPLARVAGTALSALDSDPLADAALSVVRGTETSEELERLVAAAPDDALAKHVLALKVRRLGLADAAHARYTVLHAENPRDPVVLTNLANLRFQRGDTAAATDLYERAAGLIDSPTLMFNLSQSYARSFRMEEFESAMQNAQRIGPEIVAELSRNGDPSFVADLAFPMDEIRGRLIKGARGSGFAEALRRPAAPGRLGQSWLATSLGFAAAAVLGLLASGRWRHASRCARCGARICARCDGTVWNSKTCDGCHRLFHRPETTDTALRMARLGELRDRESRLERVTLAASLLVPGVGGLLAKRPDLAFVSILFFAWAGVSLLWRDGVVPDPMAVGAAGPLAFLLMGGMALLGYLGVVGIAQLVRRSQ